MWANGLDEGDFLELRPGAFKEVKAQFQEMDMLLKHYEKELGADRVKEIRDEVNMKPGQAEVFNPCNSNVEAAATTSYEPMSSSSDSSMNAEPGTSAGLVGVGSHDALLGDTSSDTIVNRKTPNKTKTQPCNPTEDVCQSEVIKKKKTHTDTTNNNITVSARKVGEDNTAGSKTAVELLDSQWTTRMMKHRRAADSHNDQGLLRVNCVCGFQSNHSGLLEGHLKREIFGKMFKCTYQNCGYSYGWSQFYMFQNHCMNHHQLKIWNEAGCFMCGTQFKTFGEQIVHQEGCPGKSRLDAAMTIQKIKFRSLPL